VPPIKEKGKLTTDRIIRQKRFKVFVIARLVIVFVNSSRSSAIYMPACVIAKIKESSALQSLL
jgi:hypothetical protein